MTPEEAIKTAIEYEKDVAELYLEAVQGTEHKGAKKFFQLMHDEEQMHVDYLENKLVQWLSKEDVSDTEIGSVIPSAEAVAKGLESLKPTMSKDKTASYGPEIAMLKRALKAEEKTSAFYEELAGQLPDKLQHIFRRFLEIENGHRAAVEAELDAVEGNGFWYDIQEFTMV